MLTPEHLIVAAILTCIGGAALTRYATRDRTQAGKLAFGLTVASAMMVYWAVAHVLHYGPSEHSSAFLRIPQLGFALRLHVDGLTAVFLTLAATVAMPAALYSIVYMRHYAEYDVGRYYPYFLLFLAAMYGLLSTTDMMWFFFMFWQLMTLPGYALIRFENRKPENIRAAYKFLVMMQIACAATMVGAQLLASGSGTSKYDFDTVSTNLPMLLTAKPGMTATAFALFLVGFGIKMGMWPFGQFWLPDAHPAAPSPVSAMFSGVMIKTGVYGLIRYFIWLPPKEAWAHYPLENWGAVVVVLGTITLFTGTMQALKQDQTKRLLAFSSIGQVGYILLSAGACMALLPGSTAAPTLAALALFGALFHVMNHGVFKGLLFLNAGSMLEATGTQDLNKLGGLLKFMPLTAATAIVACLSIAGMPLFGGFVSKWAIYFSAIQNGANVKYLPVCAVIAILTSGLTLALVIKFFGTSFLSRTSDLVRQRASERPLEVDIVMQIPQFFLAFICILLGILPVIGIRFLQAAMRTSQQGYGIVLAKGADAITASPLKGVAESSAAKAVFAPLALLAVLAIMFLVTWSISRLGGAKRRTAEPWLCGYTHQANCHRYVARNFYGEIKRYFRWLGGMPRASAQKTLVKEST